MPRGNQGEHAAGTLKDGMAAGRAGKNRLPDVYRKLVAQYADWEATMLPEDPNSNTGSFYGSEYADHFGNKRR